MGRVRVSVRVILGRVRVISVRVRVILLRVRVISLRVMLLRVNKAKMWLKMQKTIQKGCKYTKKWVKLPRI